MVSEKLAAQDFVELMVGLEPGIKLAQKRREPLQTQGFSFCEF